MVDLSYYPCETCNHPRKEHSQNFGICYYERGTCYCSQFERNNLKYLEWIYNEKERQNG